MSLPGEFVDPYPPATLAEALSRSDVSPRFCLQVTAGMRLVDWHYITNNGYLTPLGDFTGQFNDSVDEIVAVSVNGVALTAAPDRDTCINGLGMFYWDGVADQCLIISMPDGSNPRTRGVVVEGYAVFRFSDGPCDAGGYRWRPWLTVPGQLTRQVTPNFSGITQVGTGSVTLQNETHFFDERRKYNWDAGRATLLMGASGLPFNQFVTLATFATSSPVLNENDFTLNLQDPKVLVDTYYPTTLYDAGTYPGIAATSIGKPIQVAYGKLLGVVPVCIDTVNAIFKVAGHAIKSFDGVRVFNATTGLWKTVNFLSVNTTSATFTLSGSDWVYGTSVVVDFSGKKNADGTLMNNPADIVQDLLTSLGQPTNTAGFTNAHAWYDVGAIPGQGRKVVLAPSLYLDSQAKALSTIEEVMVNCRAYLQTMPDGSLTMTPFRTYQVSTLPTLTDTNTLLPGIKVDGAGTANMYVQAGQKPTRAQVRYSIRSAEQVAQTAVYSNAANKYTRGLAPAQEVPVPIDALFTNSDDAQYLAQALVNEYRVDPTVWTASLKWLPFTWMPGQHVHAYYPRHCIDLVLEVFKITLDLTNRRCVLTLGNLKGFEDSSGFWVLSTDLTPGGNGMGWPQLGQANDTTGEVQYTRQQAGHVHGADDFAVDTTNPAAVWSAKDYGVSRWQ